MNFEPRTTNHGPRRIKLFLKMVLLTWLVARGAAFAGEPMYTLSATVSEAYPENATFSAQFDHPATGENIEYLFQVTERTGMNGLKNVRELKPNDILQIDYFKTANGSLVVEYMARVKMSGAPEGLEKFNPADLFKK